MPGTETLTKRSSSEGSDNTAFRRLVKDMLVADADPAQLSGNQLVLLREIARGRSNDEIASLMGKRTDEVVAGVRELLKTLSLAGRAQIVLYAIVHRLVAADEVRALTEAATRH